MASKLLAIVIGEIAICLMRLNDLARATGYVDRIDSLSDQIIGPPGAPAIVQLVAKLIGCGRPTHPPTPLIGRKGGGTPLIGVGVPFHRLTPFSPHTSKPAPDIYTRRSC